jgi:hypothetical protein
MPAQGGGWMLIGPSQYMQPPPLVDNQSHPQLTPDSTARTNHRRKRKDVDAKVKGKTIIGRKSN